MSQRIFVSITRHASLSLLVSLVVIQFAFGQKYNPKPTYVNSRHASCVQTLSFSPCGKTLVTGSWDTSVKLWESQLEPTLIKDFGQHSDAIERVAFSHSGHLLAIIADSIVEIWEVETSTRIRRLFNGKDVVSSVSFSPDDKKVVVGYLDVSGTIYVWDIQSGKISLEIKAHDGFVSNAIYSPAGNTIASSSWDRSIKIWDAKSGLIIRTLEGHTNHVKDIDFSSKGNLLISGGDDNKVRLWDVATGQLIRTLRGHRGAVNSVHFGKDDKWIASAGEDKIIHIWDGSNYKVANTLKGHTQAIHVVRFSPDGSAIASGSQDGTFRIWRNYAL